MKFFNLGARKFYFAKYRKLFWGGFFYFFELKKFPPEKFYFPKHKKNVFENI